MSARSVVVALLLVVAALLGGCGGDGADEETERYIGGVRGAQTRFAASVERIGRQPGGSTVTARSVDGFGAAVDRMAEELRRVDAPGRVERLHARLVREVDDFHDALVRAQRALRSRDRQAILAQRSRLMTSATRAIREIEATLKRIDRELRS